MLLKARTRSVEIWIEVPSQKPLCHQPQNFPKASMIHQVLFLLRSVLLWPTGRTGNLVKQLQDSGSPSRKRLVMWCGALKHFTHLCSWKESCSSRAGCLSHPLHWAEQHVWNLCIQQLNICKLVIRVCWFTLHDSFMMINLHTALKWWQNSGPDCAIRRVRLYSAVYRSTDSPFPMPVFYFQQNCTPAGCKWLSVIVLHGRF